MTHITTYLTFKENAEAAANLYVSLFDNSRILSVFHFDASSKGMSAPAATVEFELQSVRYTAMDGGEHFAFSDGISLQVMCDDQAQVDKLWNGLTADGGKEGQCGWLHDKYGLAWQIIPKRMMELMGSGTPEQAGRVMAVVQQSQKLNIAELEAAFEG